MTIAQNVMKHVERNYIKINASELGIIIAVDSNINSVVTFNRVVTLSQIAIVSRRKLNRYMSRHF